jgi:O-antigen/teichoic acid export membrane protein
VPFFYREKEVFLFSLLIVFAQFLNPVWFLQGIENFKAITVINVISKIIYVIFVFLFITQRNSYYLANLYWGIGAIAANLAGLAWIVKKFGFSFSKTIPSDVVALLSRDGSLCVSQLFLSMQQYAPVMVISYFGGDFLAGQFKIVEQIIVVFKTYLYLFFNFVYPRVCYLIDVGQAEAIRFWKRYNGLNFLFILFLMGGVYLFSERIVIFFHATDVSDTVELLRFAVLIPVVFAISIPLQQLMLGFGKQRLYIGLTIAMVVVNISAIAAMLPLFGLGGVFGVMLLTEALLALIYYFNLKDRFEIRSEMPVGDQGNG